MHSPEQELSAKLEPTGFEFKEEGTPMKRLRCGALVAAGGMQSRASGWRRMFRGAGVPLLVLAWLATSLQAQWLTQRVPLQPGWNAVHLEVQPEPGACVQVFAGAPVESVWKWDRRFSTIQFVVDPDTLLPEDPDWRLWLPPSDPRAFLSRLFELQGGQSYLIKVADNAAPFTLAIKGRVLLPRLDWYPHSLNLVGLPVHTNQPPTFTDFFRFTPEVDTARGYANELYRLDTQGRGQRIVQPARDRVQAGVAYWIACARAPATISALEVSPNGASALDFGTLLIEQDLAIKNADPTKTYTVWVRQRPSELPPPNAAVPELAGPVPLSYLSKNASNEWTWIDFPAAGVSRALRPGEEWRLQLGVRRADFAPYTPQGANGAACQSILEVTDAGESLLIRVPVTAQKPKGLLTPDPLEPHDENEGLWVGNVTVNRLNAPAYTGDQLLSASSPASFRLLVHVDGQGRANLLQEVVLAWDPTLTDAPHTNGTYALYADERAVPAGASDINRISSVAFPIMPPTPLTGSFTNTLTGEVTVRFDDPANPFLHRYHPLHDNKDWNFKPYTNAVESRTIVRDITLVFNAASNPSANPFAGGASAAGTYRETLSGLRAQAIHTQGAFFLQRISQINQLRALTP